MSAPKKDFCKRGHARTPDNVDNCNACKMCKAIRQQNDVDYIKEHFVYQIKYLYGIDSETYQQMLKDQDNKCALCGKEFGIARADKPNVDHCHESGKVRKLICHRCNISLGMFKDSVELLQKAIDYLKQF